MISRRFFYKILSNSDLCVSWYLMASYLYYKTNFQIMTDSEYDLIGLVIYKNWDKITHPHKKFITIEKDNISGFNIVDYPKIVEGAALQAYNILGK